MSNKNEDSRVTKNRGGRPRTYEVDELKKILNRYLAEKNPSQITLKGLVEYSGLPIQAWRFCKEIRDEIKKINKRIENIPFIVSTDGITDLLNIPSPEEIVNANYNNKPKLVKIIGDLIDVYQYTLKKSLTMDDLEKENKKLKKRIEILEADVEFYKEEVKLMTISSTSERGRKENNIAENVLDIKKHSKANVKHKNLFDD